MPYNYLFFDSVIVNEWLPHNILILDEAHNVERVCEEASSVKMTLDELITCITELKNYKTFEIKSYNSYYIDEIISTIERFLFYIENCKLQVAKNARMLSYYNIQRIQIMRKKE